MVGEGAVLDQELTIDDIPVFPDYITVARAAQLLGQTKEGIYHKIYSSRTLPRVFKVLGADENSRAILLIHEADVLELRDELKRTEAARASEPYRLRLRAWYQRVKTWGRENGFDPQTIHHAGPATLQLQKAYINTHPYDRRPEDE